MKRHEKHSIKVPVTEERFEDARAFIDEQLKGNDVSDEISYETFLIFEALFHTIIAQDFTNRTVLDISWDSQLGDYGLKISFKGKGFDPTFGGEGGYSPELKILESFDDRIAYSYRSGYNGIRISVKRSATNSLVSFGICILLAVIAYIPLSFLFDDGQLRALRDGYVFPVEELFANAVVMIGAPVTLFSLLKNTADIFILSDRSSRVRALYAKTLITSIIAIVMALFLGGALGRFVSPTHSHVVQLDNAGFNWTFADFISPIVPSSILEPFESISPFPLIVVAMLATYALCSVGKQFDVLKSAIDSGYALFSRMLQAIMAVLPLFCSLALFDVLLTNGLGALVDVVWYLLMIVVGVVPLLLTYVIRLRMCGIEVIPFVKTMIPLIVENIKIGSAIDATAYNVRYCAKQYKMNRKRLNASMPILAQINLNGNCYLIMLVTMILIVSSGISVAWFELLVIATLVLFLSFGAPNQPGGIIIGILIILTYLNSYFLLPMTIYLEVFVGNLQNAVNVISDIVMIAEEEQKAHKELAAKKG